MKTYIYLLLLVMLSIPMVCLAEEETLGDLIEAGEEVIITATKTETKISEAPSIVYVITEEDIRQKGYRSLMEAMASVPGFTVINDHIISSLSIRGMNGVRMWNATLKIMIDGQTASFRPYTLTFIDEEFVPMVAIKRIEIIRGPCSALYGANAYLGVINIITKDGVDMKGGVFSAETGSMDRVHSEFVYGNKFGDVEFLLSVSALYEDRSGLKLPEPIPAGYDDIETKNDFARMGSAFGKISYKGLSLSGNFQRLDDHGEFTDWGVLTHKDRIQVDNWFIKGMYERKLLDDKLYIKGLVAHSEGRPGDKDHLNTGSSVYWIQREINYIATDIALEANYNLDIGFASSFLLGVDYIIEDQQPQNNILHFDDETTPSMRLSDMEKVDFTNTGLYGQFVYYPINSFGITAGGRYDDNKAYETAFSPRVGMVYVYEKRANFKLLYGGSFKPPTSRQLYDVSLGSRGNEELTPQTAKTIEAELGVKVNENLKVTGNTFINYIRDVIQLQAVTDTALLNQGIVSKYNNVGEVDSYGFEGIVEIFTEEYGNYYLNFSYQNTEETLEETDETQKTVLVPEMTANLGLNYLLKDYVNINLENRWVGESVSPKIGLVTTANDTINDDRYPVDAHFISDITLSTQNLNFLGKETIFYVGMRNILDTEYAHPGNTDKNIDIPQYGRTFFVRLKQMF